MNMGSSVFTDYMNTSLSGTGDAEGLAQYRDYIYNSYTSAPVIRDSVSRWLDTVTKDAESDYERLLAVERALSGFTYNARTGKIPVYSLTLWIADTAKTVRTP